MIHTVWAQGGAREASEFNGEDDTDAVGCRRARDVASDGRGVLIQEIGRVGHPLRIVVDDLGITEDARDLAVDGRLRRSQGDEAREGDSREGTHLELYTRDLFLRSKIESSDGGLMRSMGMKQDRSVDVCDGRGVFIFGRWEQTRRETS